KCALFRNNAIYFLDTGLIYFKGVRIPTCEAVFRESERYKEQFSEELTRLFGSLRESLWEQRIYLDLMDLISKVASVMKPFSVTLDKPVNSIQVITNESMSQLCRIGTKAYTHDEDYTFAVQLLKDFSHIIERIPDCDKLILDYLKGITEKYEEILSSYNKTIDKEIDERAGQIFQSNHLKAYQAAKNAAAIFEKLKIIGRNSPAITKKKALWFKLIQQNKEQMEFTLYSGKK
ncbi:MAG: hypothetical protein LBP29_09025, partial [Treponema sp.]|nr:hypothetical protein [Treponema sp.]